MKHTAVAEPQETPYAAPAIEERVELVASLCKNNSPFTPPPSA